MTQIYDTVNALMLHALMLLKANIVRKFSICDARFAWGQSRHTEVLFLKPNLMGIGGLRTHISFYAHHTVLRGPN
jgi:hypothetical protein